MPSAGSPFHGICVRAMISQTSAGEGGARTRPMLLAKYRQPPGAGLATPPAIRSTPLLLMELTWIGALALAQTLCYAADTANWKAGHMPHRRRILGWYSVGCLRHVCVWSVLCAVRPCSDAPRPGSCAVGGHGLGGVGD